MSYSFLALLYAQFKLDLRIQYSLRYLRQFSPKLFGGDPGGNLEKLLEINIKIGDFK